MYGQNTRVDRLALQNYTHGMPSLAALLMLVLAVAVTAPVAAQESADELTKLLNEAVRALGQEEFERGLKLLDEAQAVGRADARIAYYRGYALEKLGECKEAKRQYRDAAKDPSSSEKLRAVAVDALAGVDERCQVATPAPTPEPQANDEHVRELAPMGSGRTGWKIVGWTSLGLGALTLLAVPVKVASEQQLANQSRPYFEMRYGCDVEWRTVTGDECDAEALLEDEVYQEYDQRVRAAQRSTTYLASAGIGLVGIGVVTLLTVGFSRPSVAVSWSPEGLALSIGGQF